MYIEFRCCSKKSKVYEYIYKGHLITSMILYASKHKPYSPSNPRWTPIFLALRRLYADILSQQFSKSNRTSHLQVMHTQFTIHSSTNAVNEVSIASRSQQHGEHNFFFCMLLIRLIKAILFRIYLALYCSFSLYRSYISFFNVSQ